MLRVPSSISLCSHWRYSTHSPNHLYRIPKPWGFSIEYKENIKKWSSRSFQASDHTQCMPRARGWGWPSRGTLTSAPDVPGNTDPSDPHQGPPRTGAHPFQGCSQTGHFSLDKPFKGEQHTQRKVNPIYFFGVFLLEKYIDLLVKQTLT